MKWIKRLIIVVVLLVVVVGGAVFYFKDALVKKGVITGGDMVLGQGSTQLDSANFGLFGGTLKLTGLKLDNPDQFKQPHFFQLAGTDVAVSLGSLMDDTVVVPNVTLDGLHVVAETSLEKGLPKLNLITIKKTVDAAVGGPSEPADPAKEGKKFVIQTVNITNMKVTGALTMPGGASVPVDIKVPDFTLTGIGEKDNGVVMKEVIAILLDAILKKAIEGVGQVGGVGLDMFEGGADALKGLGGEALKGIGGAGEGAGEAIQKGLGGLLGGNKEKAAEPPQE